MTDNARAVANKQARDERKKVYLVAMMGRYTAEFLAAGNQDAPAVARSTHATIDNVLERDRKISAASGAIKCHRGCNYCCHGPVEISPHEAALLVQVARDTGIAMDRARLERQSRYTMDTWRQQPAADTACVFLGEGGVCNVYRFRPNACRKLLVTSDPRLCDAASHSADEVERWVSWEAEILQAAALEVFGAGLMPRLLLAAQGSDG